eukprot:jgi/Mesen1/6391/ME000329S05552
MSGPDTLFPLRSNFYLGAYQAAINEANVDGLSEAESIERDCIVYRSYIALGSYQLVIDEINSSAATALQAVKLLAIYLSGSKVTIRETVSKWQVKAAVFAIALWIEKALESLQEWLADPAIGSNTTLLLIAGTILTHEQNWNDALKHTHGGATLDLLALTVQIYLKMDRVDYAEKTLKAMQSVDEDAILTQLSNAWVNLGLGGAKIQEAFYIFTELSEKYNQTVALMNGIAVCHMHKGQYEEAEGLLLEALNKDSKDANTLANLVVCELHRGKPHTRYMNQLKTTAPNHVLVHRAAAANDMFEKAVAAYA